MSRSGIIASLVVAGIGIVFISGQWYSGPGHTEGGCGPGAVCAPENDRPVPAVTGMPVEKACESLGRDGYSGGIFAVRSSGGG